MSIVGARNNNSAHGIENAWKKGHIGIAKIAGILLQQRRNQELLEEYIAFAGRQLNAGMLPQPAPATLVLGIFGFEFALNRINAGPDEGAGSMSVLKEDIELLLGRQRAPVFDYRIRAAINGLPELSFYQLFYLLDAGLRRAGRRTTLRRLLPRLISGHLNRVRRWRALRHSHH